MIRTAGLAALTTALAAALLLPLAPASAESDSHRDAARDVTRVTTEAVNGGITATRPDRSHAMADIVAFRTRYGPRNIQITLKLRELPRRVANDHWSGGYATVETPDRGYDLSFSRQGPRLAVDLHRASGRSQDCRGLAGAVLLRRKALRVTIPAGCLDDPRWIRTGARVGFESVSALPDSWIDDARATGWHSDGPKLGKRIRRS